MSINISISVPTGFASNENSSMSALKINGNELIQSSPATLSDNTAIVKRIDELEAKIKNINAASVITKDDTNTEQTNDYTLVFAKRLNDIDSMIRTLNSKNDNTTYFEDRFHETDKSIIDLKKCCIDMANNYKRLNEYTNNLENRFKSLEEYTQKLEQRLNQEVKKVEAIVVEAVPDPETIDIESVGETISDAISETIASEVAEEDKESAVEEIDNIDGEEVVEEVEETVEETEDVEEAVQETEDVEEAVQETEEIVEETEEEAEEEGMAVEEFEYKGNTYYRDEDNFVYQMSEEGELSEALGVWNTATEKIRFYAKK